MTCITMYGAYGLDRLVKGLSSWNTGKRQHCAISAAMFTNVNAVRHVKDLLASRSRCVSFAAGQSRMCNMLRTCIVGYCCGIRNPAGRSE